MKKILIITIFLLQLIYNLQVYPIPSEQFVIISGLEGGNSLLNNIDISGAEVYRKDDTEGKGGYMPVSRLSGGKILCFHIDTWRKVLDKTQCHSLI